MINPRMDQLREHVDTNYAMVIVAARRARQINAYYHALSEGSYEEYAPPMVDSDSRNQLTIALEEVAAGKVAFSYPEQIQAAS